MPQLAAAAITTGAILAKAKTAWDIAAAAMVIGSAIHGHNKARRQRRLQEKMERAGSGFNIGRTDPPRSLIVGRALVPTERIAFLVVHGEDRERVSFIACFGGHEIDEIEEIYFNNKPIGLAFRDEDGWVTTGEFQKTRYSMDSGSFEWPAPNASILLPLGADTVSSVMELSGDGASLLTLGVHYAVEQHVMEEGLRTYVKALAPSAPYQGRTFVITYRMQTYKSYVRALPFKGSEAGNLNTVMMALDSRWTANHLLKGTPHVHFELIWDVNIFGATGFPDITYKVRGAKCWDFVEEEYSWTDNSARIAAWFMTRPEGFNITLDDIDTNLAIAAQNACDEAVPYGEDGTLTQVRYTANGVLSTEENPIENLRTILGSMVGRVCYVGGTWDIYAGVPLTPTYTLEDDDLAGKSEKFISDAPLDQRYNGVRGKYMDASLNYIVRDAVPYQSPTYLAADGEPSWLDVDLPLTTDAWMAQRILRLLLHRSRVAATWKTTYKISAYPVRGAQWVRCRHSQYGWETLESNLGKTFEVTDRKFHASGEVELTMLETSAAIFAWNYDEGRNPDPAKNTAFPDPTFVEQPRDVTLFSSASTYDIGTDGTYIPYVKLSWRRLTTQTVLDARHIKIKWKSANEVGYRTDTVGPEQTTYKLRPVWGGMAIAGEITVVTTLGIESDPVFFEHRAAMDLPGNQQTVSANLLTNATFKGGVKGWIFNTEAGTTDPYIYRKPVTQYITGSPTQVAIEQTGVQNKHAVLVSEAVSVYPGRRYCAYCSVMGTLANVRIQLVFYNATGAAIYTAVGNTVPAAVIGASAAMPGNYGISETFTDAPADAVTARLWFVKFGTINIFGASSSRGDFYKPFLGEIRQGSNERPPWDPGGLPTIDFSQLERYAATEILLPTVPDIQYELSTLSPPFPQNFTVYSFTPSFDADLEITLTARVVCQATSGTAVAPSAWLSTAGGIVKPGQPDPAGNRITMISVPGNSTRAGHFTVTLTLQARAGVPTTIYLFTSASAMPSSITIVPGGVVPKPAPQAVPCRVQIAGITTRLTLVKV